MSLSELLRWTGLAIAGIAIAAGVSIAASGLSSQNIGLASEPLSAGHSLAPPVKRHGRRHQDTSVHRGRHHAPAPASAPTSPAPVTPVGPATTATPPAVTPAPVAPHPPPAADDSGGGGGGDGGGADD